MVKSTMLQHRAGMHPLIQGLGGMLWRGAMRNRFRGDPAHHLHRDPFRSDVKYIIKPLKDQIRKSFR
ncbi:hypothetical protein [Bosea sp. (in: a-proteobacteria)]|uniref:hypothetical protein n=1 Tax=Bosea sp. (in: a-proteobacteria) TaxID=1871050 RepID=UPI00262D40CB|nr:hypothetical protein [Bosea sp. (in: a-proteobacteria)]MCO5091029.1 hypothetical protein [Bosea sp. (in: a-proteobacteria)]